MTGDLTISKTFPKLILDHVGSSVDTEGHVRVTNGWLFISADGGVTQAVRVFATGAVQIGPNQETQVSASGAVTVPAISGTSQAAQVTAYDATTGRLAIGGHEIGDAGWRDIAADQVNGWAFFSILVRRVGPTVFLQASDGGGSPADLATDAVVITMPSGFRAPEGPTRPAYNVPNSSPATEYRGFINTANGQLTGPDGLGGRLDIPTFSFPTNDAWPTTLPGAAT